MRARNVGKPAEILLVEDEENEVELTKEGFARANLMVNLHHVDDGEKCLAFLRKQVPYADVPTPDLILLDLNMPRMDGREVMAEIVRDEALRHLPVVVLTTSSAEEDILEMYRLRCNSYIIKPVGFEEFVQAITLLGGYWLTLTMLPGAPV
jgi:two-component system, chemotaxis family, response regulator Rcp1